jgi:hypothetical protein
MLKIYEELKQSLPSLLLDIVGNTGTVSYNGQKLFETTGPETISVLHGYLQGLQHGLLIGKK